jgi:RNA polymerase sigma factor (sigma-70 family)
MPSDHELLQDFARNASQEAFRSVVERHVNAVYAAARRQTRDPQLAEDVAQVVFIVLARKAAKLDRNTPLAGWLMKTTFFACRDAIKAETRRRRHEQKAASMKPAITEEDLASAVERISPELDAAMMKLSDADRGAVAMRYFENHSIAEVASAMGISAEAATKRISRAIDKLRRWLTHRGAMSAATLPLAAILEHLPQQAAPANLVTMTTAAATSTAAASAWIAGISKGTINMMIWSKAKAAVVVLGATLLAGGAGVGTVSLVLAQNNDANPGAAPAQVVQAAAPAGAFIGRLNNGVSIELVGVCESPSTGNAWWYPDGTPLPRPPYHHMSGRSTPDPRGIAKDFAIRTRNQIKDAMDNPATISWYVQDSTGSSSSTCMDANNQRVPDIEGHTVSLRANLPAAVLRCNVASGPWRTRQSTTNTGNSAMSNNDTVYLFSATFEPKPGETHIVFTRIEKEISDATRMVAIDLAGKEHAMTSRSSITSGGQASRIHSGEYAVHLPAAQIREFRFQSRPYNQWIEIRNISLNLGQETQVQVVTSDSPAK